MAGKSKEQAEIQELIRLSAQAREDLGARVSKYGRVLKMPGRMADSLRHHPNSWLLGSLAAGLAGSLLLNRMPRSRKKRHTSLKRKVLSFTFSAARPFAKIWLGKKIKELTGAWIADRLQPGARQHSPFQVEPESKSGLNTEPNTRSEPNPYSANVRTKGS